MKLFCWILIVLSASISWANEPSDVSEKQLLALLKPANSFTAHFNQQSLDSHGKSFQTLSGVLHGKKPDKVHWSVFEPAAQTIVSNGSHLWLYDPDLEQVIIEPYISNSDTNPISLLLGNPQQLSENFDVLEHSVVTQSIQRFTLKPVKLNVLYSDLIVEFKDQILSAISFTDSLGQTTRLDIKEFILNPLFKDEFFTFQVPKGVDIVSHVH
jgi:outer membrane lipoprotein carrier protein